MSTTHTRSDIPARPVFVTGASGFIGRHLVEELIRTGRTLRCLLRPSRTPPAWLLHPNIEIVGGELLDTEAYVRALEGSSAVIHLAGVTKAKKDGEYLRGNVDGTEAILRSAERAGVRRFVHISSLTAVGPSTDGRLLDEQAPCVPLTAYGRSKLAAENLVRGFQNTLPTTILRPPAVYGPGDRDTLEMFRWISFGIKPQIGAPHRTLSLIHATDLARGIVLAAFHERAVGETFFITDPIACQFSDLIDELARIVHRKPIPVRIPASALFIVAALVEGISTMLPRPAVLSIDKARDMVQPHWVCSGEKARQSLGFVPSIRLADGLRETYAWYRSAGWIR